jgi:hypothetical protein
MRDNTEKVNLREKDGINGMMVVIMMESFIKG